MTVAEFAAALPDLEFWRSRTDPVAIKRRASLELGVPDHEVPKLPVGQVMAASTAWLDRLTMAQVAFEHPVPEWVMLPSGRYLVEDVDNMSYGLWSDITAMSRIEDPGQRMASVAALLLLAREDEPHTERMARVPEILAAPMVRIAPLLGFFLRTPTRPRSATRTSTHR